MGADPGQQRWSVSFGCLVTPEVRFTLFFVSFQPELLAVAVHRLLGLSTTWDGVVEFHAISLSLFDPLYARCPRTSRGQA
jgi:hypothetical protein